MYNELRIHIGSESRRVFLQAGFYTPNLLKMPLHKHNYPEIHVVTGGEVLFHVADQVHSSTGGNLVIIPADTFHYVETQDPRACHTAFQVDYDVRSFAVHRTNPQTVLDFVDEIAQCRKSGNYAAVAPYMALFLQQLSPTELTAQPIRDYKFLICEFFFKRYSENLRLSDLAKELNLSERQTERLVIQTTGHTFRQELAAVRIHAAKHLLKTTEDSMAEVAHQVGYDSYAGFWKALKKHEH